MIDHLYVVVFGVFESGHLGYLVLLFHNECLFLEITLRGGLDEDWFTTLDAW